MLLAAGVRATRRCTLALAAAVPAARLSGTRGLMSRSSFLSRPRAPLSSSLLPSSASQPRWRSLLAAGTVLISVTGFTTLAAADKEPTKPATPALSSMQQLLPDAARLHAAREKMKLQAKSSEGISDEGIVLTKLLKPSNGKPLVVLVACGSYSPITNMHLLVFEQARNYLQLETNKYDIIGGFLSPVHDAYGKSSLIDQHHRHMMCEAAVAGSKWLSVQEWEMRQPGWTTTAETLCKYQSALNNAHLTEEPIRVKMLCGADLIESTLVPDLWAQADLDVIFGTLGVVVIERIGLDLASVIASSPVLSRYKDNIDIVPQRIVNTISSTSVRNLIRSQQSPRFLTPDAVIDYIHEHRLYGHDPAKHVPAEYLKPREL